jgi:hypothetical protein
MSCDHERLKKDAATFEAGTRPVLRDGVQARQFGARLADCPVCNSTFMHPADVHLVDAYLDAQDAEVGHAA